MRGTADQASTHKTSDGELTRAANVLSRNQVSKMYAIEWVISKSSYENEMSWQYFVMAVLVEANALANKL